MQYRQYTVGIIHLQQEAVSKLKIAGSRSLIRHQSVENRQLATGNTHNTGGNKQQAEENRQLATGNTHKTQGNRQQAVEKQAIGNRQYSQDLGKQAVGSRKIGNWQQAILTRPRGTGSRVVGRTAGRSNKEQQKNCQHAGRISQNACSWQQDRWIQATNRSVNPFDQINYMKNNFS